MSQDTQEVVQQDGPENDAGTSEEKSTPPPSLPPEKKVVVNDDPEYFELDPDTAHVKPVEKLPPPPPEQPPASSCPPPMDPQHLEEIIAETLNTLENSQKTCNDQKLVSQKLAFMMTCIQDSLQLYSCHLERLNTFLVHSDRLHTRWVCQTQSGLRCYEDYPLVLRDVPEPVQVDEVEVPVPEQELRQLVEVAVDNFLAGGLAAQATRAACKMVDEKVDERRCYVTELLNPFDSWFALLNKASEHQDALRDMLFKVTANVSFLKTGEIVDSLVLDLAKELETAGAKKHS